MADLEERRARLERTLREKNEQMARLEEEIRRTENELEKVKEQIAREGSTQRSFDKKTGTITVTLSSSNPRRRDRQAPRAEEEMRQPVRGRELREAREPREPREPRERKGQQKGPVEPQQRNERKPRQQKGAKNAAPSPAQSVDDDGDIFVRMAQAKKDVEVIINPVNPVEPVKPAKREKPVKREKPAKREKPKPRKETKEDTRMVDGNDEENQSCSVDVCDCLSFVNSSILCTEIIIVSLLFLSLKQVQLKINVGDREEVLVVRAVRHD